MQGKGYENPLVIHRPRKRRNLMVESKPEQHHQNLKALHQTLLCQESRRNRKGTPERASVIQINKNGGHLSRRPPTEASKSKEKDRPVNFYINIERLRNLKIGGRNRDGKRTQSSHSLFNNYVRRDNLHKQRRSQLLKSYGARRQKVQSQQSHHARPDPIGRQSMEKDRVSRARNRYVTQTDQGSPEGRLAQSANKKAVFRRAHNESIVKDRTFIEGYLRGKQLGRGGFSKVWEGFHFKSKTFYAIKQIDTTNKYQTHLTEIWFGGFFFQDGQPKRQFLGHPGIDSLLRMYTYSIMDPRAFIVFQTCGGSIGNMLYDIYEQDRQDDIAEDDKLYMIKYKQLYSELRQDTLFLKTMLLQIAQALDLLAIHKIVHSDIKTENILMNVKEEGAEPKWDFKLIDYGSSFIFQNLKQYKLATPQYMCPELLNYILFENKKPHKEEMLPYVKNFNNTSAIDVWGLGCILIELIHGVPLWLTNRTKIMVNGKFETKRGLFAVNDRSFSKILERQLHLVANMDVFLRKENNGGVILDATLKTLLRRMLNPNPAQRIRPVEIIAILGEELV